MNGAHHRSVAVQPYGLIAAGVVSVSGVGSRKENMLVMKKPPLAMTREDSKRVHGEDAMTGDAWVITGLGMRLHRSNARVNPSTTDNGSSVLSDMDGITGIYSTIACAAMYTPGETPERTKDGGTASRVPMMASPPNLIVSEVHASLRKDLSSTSAGLSPERC